MKHKVIGGPFAFSQRPPGYALVDVITEIRPHPNGDRVEVVKLSSGVELVTGKHYRVGLPGIHLLPGCRIPGWLAADCWLPSTDWFEVRSIPIRGVESPGIFVGSEYMTDGSKASLDRADALYKAGGKPGGDGWITWPYWRKGWKLGDRVDSWLGVVPHVEPGWTFGDHANASVNPLATATASGGMGFGGPSGVGSMSVPGHAHGGLGPHVGGVPANTYIPPLDVPSALSGGPPVIPQAYTTYCPKCGGVKSNPPSQSHSIWCSCTPSPL